MAERRFSSSTILIVAALAAAAAFALGKTMKEEAPPGVQADQPLAHEPPRVAQGAPPAATEALPPGHPPVEQAPPGSAFVGPGDVTTSLAWKAPARWQSAPNPSSMRLATYKIPRAQGDSEDPELAISQAGGSIDANVDRWISQFGPEAAKTAKRTTRKVGDLDVTVVEVSGTFAAGGMGMPSAAPGPRQDWALLGAIVATPSMPHFFKMTGPTKSVQAARAEMDELLGSLTVKK